ncbi:ATP-binding protein [Patulibacter minatonensis]|uniref:ATP-binding protein n=1 Tax=Patulibacter minatonensis TaxID=298163 RepID=UPI0009FFD3F8|nr:ATP-binding protein [Patulibacter minatonensis]
MAAPAPGSFHARMVERHPSIPRTVVSKAAMTRISRVIESVAETDGPATVLVGGFQYERYWRSASERYARSGVTTIALARPGRTRTTTTGGAFVPVPAGHALESEWFVVALGPSVSVVLSGLDRGEARTTGPAQDARTFDVVLSTDPGAVHAALDLLVADPALPFPDEARRALVDRARERSDLPAPAPDPSFADRMLTALLEQADHDVRRLQERDAARDHVMTEISDHERRRLVEVVHDESLQHLLAAHQDLEELEEVGPDEPPPIDLQETRATLEEGIQHLRAALAGTLDDAAPDGLGEPLRTVAARAARRGGFEATVSVDPAAAGLFDDHVVSCAREALVNAAKHARARRVDVTVVRRSSPDEIVVVVEDDGVGMTPDALREAREDGHLGLTLSRSRIEQVGGTWSLNSAPGEGVRVRATIPVPMAA